MTHFLLLLLSAIILGDVISIDPIEGIVRDFAYAVRKTIQQAVNQFRLPIRPDLSFQSDTDDSDNTFRCPLCNEVNARINFVGSWNVILWSRSFFLTVMGDLNKIIDRLEAGKPIYADRQLNDIFSEIPEIRCPRLTVLNSTESSKFEYAYQVLNGRQKSIIGTWERLPDSTFFWRIAPTLNTRLCVAYTNIANLTNNYDFVVFNQIDSWPSCSNFIAMSRARTPDLANNLRDFLEQQRIEGVFNKIEKVLCPYNLQEIAPVTQTLPPIPDDPFELPNSNNTRI